MKWIVAMLAALTLAGCDSDSEDTPGTVYIECADVVNDGTTTQCEETKTAWLMSDAHAAVTIIEAGVVSRGELIEVTTAVNNDTPDLFAGYYSLVFDGGCNGNETWEMASYEPTPEVPAGATWSIISGGACGDMPLGDRTLTSTLYGADPANVLDVVEVQFELVE